MTSKTILPFIFFVLICGWANAQSKEHQRLLYRNQFKNPENVVEYYCARDASGFVWSGLLEIERKAFTTWDQVPQQDTFFIAKSYQVTRKHHDRTSATVEVKYDVLGMGDAHGTRLPSSVKQHTVLFRLKKTNGKWKIHAPSPDRLAPVVLESKFPYTS